MLKPTYSRHKRITLLLIPILLISFALIALDIHLRGFHPTCPICRAHVSLNGGQNSVTVEVALTAAYYSPVEKSHGFTIPISVTVSDRAPPQLHQG